MKKRLPSLALFVILLHFQINGQNLAQKATIKAHTNIEALNHFIAETAIEKKQNKTKAFILAKLLYWPEIIETPASFSELVGVTSKNQPIYYTTDNRGAGETIKANKVYTNGELGLNVNGEGMILGIWDRGTVRLDHEIFENRVVNKEGTVGSTAHATHVAGTMIGSGLVMGGAVRGMAPKATVHTYNWSNDIIEVATAAAEGLILSNHSYGYNTDFVDLYQWGKYDDDSQAFDEIMFNAPYYQFVCSAGNARNDGVNEGKDGYDLLTGHKLCKNGITVAAVEQVDDYNTPADVIMSVFSNWGGTDDGRIKPDICAKGVRTFSSVNSSSSSYIFKNGTSMSSPSVAGGLALLQQHYVNENESFMRAATLKGLVVHTADEAGAADGPDYKYGWGLMNVERAAHLISDNGLFASILEIELTNQQIYSVTVTAQQLQNISATLSWTDPAGSIPPDAIDYSNPRLINDLDIRITQAGEVFMPWKLNVFSPASAASKGDNIVDNIEKVDILNASGEYTITISHKGNLVDDSQHFSLIISGINTESFWFTPLQENIAICKTQNTHTIDFELSTVFNFSNEITFSTGTLPSELEATFSPNGLNNAGDFSILLEGILNLDAGEYPILIRASTADNDYELSLLINVYDATPLAPIPIFPIEEQISMNTTILFQWQNIENESAYYFELAKDPDFETIVYNDTVIETSVIVNNLDFDTQYFWRLKSQSPCGDSGFTGTQSFYTLCGFAPFGIYVVDATFTTITVDWMEISSVDSWEIEIVSQGTNPTGIGEVVSEKPYTFMGLTSGIAYDIYMRSLCGNSASQWSEPFLLRTQEDFCNGDHFYDSGGELGDYDNFENTVLSVFPENAGDYVKAAIHSFSTSAGFDYMYIYDGPDDSYPLIETLTGFSIPDFIRSTHLETGALTFVFVSNGSVTSEGWDISFTCQTFSPCYTVPEHVSLNYATTTSLNIIWDNIENITSWDVALMPEGEAPVNALTTIDPSYSFEGLDVQTAYDFYIRLYCEDGVSDWIFANTFTTLAFYCQGEHFYDSGGVNGDYGVSEYKMTTIFPESKGQALVVTFLNFNTELDFDFLHIYDGPNDSYPLIISATGVVELGTITATDEATGALTFIFKSDGVLTRDGWDATFSCLNQWPEINPPFDGTLNYFPNPTSNTLNIRSKTFITQLDVYDLAGRLIAVLPTINQQNFEVDLSVYKNGMYYMKVYYGEGEWSAFKVIKL